ncbi:interferon-induced very large GTPase 1-like [Sinocyclocheilus anshuiensis]|uniref:interferon-induced very large GTPase 1-like n=1 Tax=Sinocyclocheilus anshuiensis TaxID=1608454 RepID=UPI0007BA6E0D|nr:PREDICTED: interferon-induced very large GTPase 1-like [Sinocyclocheilus anshuiensis]
MDPSLTIVLFGNSSSVQFGHENILLGEKQTNIENAKISSTVPLMRKILECHVSVINMTGLHETDHDDHFIRQILNENEIHTFIFVVRLGQLTDADKLGLEWLQRVFGEKVLQFVMILFTHAREEECDTIIDDLKKNPVLEQLLEKCGGRFHNCNKMMNNKSEMRDLMNKIESLFNENQQQCYTGEMFNTLLRERENLQNSGSDEYTINKEIMEQMATTGTKERHMMRKTVHMLNVLWSIAGFLIIIFLDCIKQLQKVIFKVLSKDGKRLGQYKEDKNREKVKHLFNKLHLKDQHDKLRTADVLQLTEHSCQTHESCAEEELVKTFLQKLQMMNYRARYIKTKEQTNELIPRQHTKDSHEYQADADIFKEMSLSNEGKRNDYPVHPMDVQMALFHCADGFLKQLIVTKLSQCQYALPLLVPDPFTQQIEFPLWTFRQVKKSWKMRNNNKIISQTQPNLQREIKESFLPCQGKLWHQWSQMNKELHRLQADEIEKEICRKKTEMKKIREQQHESGISVFMKLFIKQMNSRGEHKLMYFLKWLRILLDEYISADLSALHHKYKQTELERISEELQDATFGLEHIMREIGQIYESCSSVKKNIKDLQYNFFFLPGLAAEMMISGFPLELMDGDAAHVPLVWISAVLDELTQRLGDQARVFVLSVLGIQSSGKSTMLNAMFGLQFAVSAGRCTRGAFMQLIKVSDEMKTQMNFDYILVVDTEGLRALELAGRSTRHHDNELATFVVGLGNMTLINIFGENPAEMQDILQIVVQAFMRMKKVRLNPSCVFVHQNVSDITAGEKNMEGRRRLQEKLDEMTKLASKEEVCDEECFSDVIAFDVQNDVKYIAHLWEGSPPMAPPNPDYCENIQQLKESIMSHASESGGKLLINLKYRIKDLWEALLNERFVFSFRNSLEIAVYRKLETEYSKWTWSLRSAMMNIENKIHNKIENKAIQEVEETDLQRDLKKTSEEVKTSMSEFFEKDKDKDILIQWKTSFDIKIKDVHENIVRKTKRKLNEILQQRDLKKKIDDQRTNHENTLFEKSKELALNLKDKANDEETLKKEFDLFWKQWMKMIIRDTPAIKDIDIVRDVREILSDIYESIPVDHWSESSDYNTIFTVSSYSAYVIFKKTVKETLGYNTLSQENEGQIRSLVTDVALQTDIMIQSFNISKMGYNISCIQQTTGYITARLIEHQEGPVKYKFKNEFFMDLVLSICKKENKMITDQHRLFREANDPVLYLEKKREEYYSIFQKYCHGATSAAIFGEIICQKLKEPFEQSVYKKTARDLTDEMRSNCESLNGNRSSLEKHMLKTLAEKGHFDKYMNYINNPRYHFKRFIRDEVSRYITDKFSVSVLPKMKENIKLLQQKIMKAAHESTEHVHKNRGDAGLWLKSFTQQLSEELIFSEKDLSGVKHDDVDDFNLLEDVIRQELPAIIFDISSRFNTNTFPVNLDYKDKPDELLIDHFCQCCWVQCPFCAAICTNTIENHPGDHSVSFHRVTGLTGMKYRNTTNLSISICTSAVASNRSFYPRNSDDAVLWREYRSAGEDYVKWSITSDLSELPYWKWFVCRFQKDLETHYNSTFEGSGEIPDEWRKHSKHEALESLDKYT